MSTRHRWLAVYLAVTVALPISTSPIQAGPNESGQPVGEVGLQELIELALKNDPKLTALRLSVPVAEAEKRAVVQWRDPELRLSYQTDDNVQLESPFERSGRVTETIRGSSAAEETGGRNGDASEISSSSETRTTTFREKVIPGVDSDRIISTETERRSSNSSTTSSDDRGSFDEEATETETFQSKSDTTRYTSRDRLARDESTQAKIRFWIPNPWEMKELVKQAAKEVDLANYEIIAAEREVILQGPRRLRETPVPLQKTAFDGQQDPDHRRARREGAVAPRIRRRVHPGPAQFRGYQDPRPETRDRLRADGTRICQERTRRQCRPQ